MIPTQGDNQVTFLDALYLKYCDDTAVDEVDLPQNDGHKRVCEYVGFDSLKETLKNVTNLSFINLADMNISACGLVDPQKFCLTKAQSLDLSLNQLANWQEVSRIVSLTECLWDLILSSNPLSSPVEQEIEDIKVCFKTLRVAVLGNLSYTWNDVCKCAMLWPTIQKLNLFQNNITQLSPVDNLVKNLTYLSLSKNPISDWKEICKLGSLARFYFYTNK